jgi:branched-chain amino acid transport system substrate-binding protein
VVGIACAPLNTPDFSSYLLQAQAQARASGAKVIGLANAGGDFIDSVKGANEFGITKSGKQKMAGLLVFIWDIHALGLQTTRGLLFRKAACVVVE